MMKNFEDIEFVFLPIERAVKEYYKEEKYNCFVGGDEKLLKFYGSNIENRYFSAPHMAHSSHLFTLDKKICDIKQMNNKSLIIIGRFPYKEVFAKIKLQRVEVANSVIQAVKMGVNKRADAFISYYPTPELRELDVKFCEELSFTNTLDKIHCYKSEASKEFINAWDEKLNQLMKSNKLEKILFKSFGDYSEKIIKKLK